MQESDFDTRQILSDADLALPLERVAYVDGMLLGAEATRTEQEYHRRRLNRDRYWHGQVGCVVGLQVWLEPAPDLANPVDPDDFDQGTLLLRVRPGVAYDGLGREACIHEDHCLRLADWVVGNLPALDAQRDQNAASVQLVVWIRQAACPKGQQPVLASTLNASTDAVAFTRIGDGVLLELTPVESGTLAERSLSLAAWQRQLVALRKKAEQDEPDPDVRLAYRADQRSLTLEERRWLDELLANGAPSEQLAESYRRLRLVAAEGLPGLSSRSADGVTEPEVAHLARIPLALITIASPAPGEYSLTPETIAVNNLIRPFAFSQNHELL